MVGASAVGANTTGDSCKQTAARYISAYRLQLLQQLLHEVPGVTLFGSNPSTTPPVENQH